MADRTPLRRKLIRWFAHPPQAVGAWVLYGLLAAIPLDRASALGSWLVRLVGPRMKADRIARRNLEFVFPDKTPDEHDRIMGGVWHNLGCMLGEWPHLAEMDPSGRIEVVGGEILGELRDKGGPAILIAGHYGSWEAAGHTLNRLGKPLTVIYRPAQNRWVNRLVLWARRDYNATPLAKGREAAVGAMETLKRGDWIGVLFDQKLNEGVPAPFFGRDAMTSPLPARLALAFRCPLVPTKTERLDGSRFRLTIYPPLELPDTGDRKEDLAILMGRMNEMLEGWIRERPDQWFWVHKRWPD